MALALPVAAMLRETLGKQSCAVQVQILIDVSFKELLMFVFFTQGCVGLELLQLSKFPQFGLLHSNAVVLEIKS